MLIFSKICEKPRYGKNSRLTEGFATGPGDIQLARCHLLPVPGSIAPQLDSALSLALRNEPQGAGRSHEQPKGVGANDVGQLATLILSQAIEGAGVAGLQSVG